MRWCLCRCTNATQPKTREGKFGTVGATTALVRVWRGVWKLIELEGTRLIKYAADVIASPQ